MTTSPTLEQRLDVLLDSVLGSVGGADERVNELVRSLARHLHQFVRETRPTEAEWSTGLDFLVRVGRACTERRNEAILLSDMLGLTSAIDEVGHAGPVDATPSSVEGPFHAAAPARPNGAWIATGPERHRGRPIVVHGRVTHTDGTPIEGATVDVWQADDAGNYDSQDPLQELGNLRGLFTTAADGGYWFRSVLPSSYPVPTDGPVGDLLRALGRHPMRPAHIHYRVEAGGYRPVTTHLFVADDQFLDSDAAFAVKPELVVRPLEDRDPRHAAAFGIEGIFLDLAFDVRLARQEAGR
jgi:catechol 1,2-dioxygenase